MKATRRRRRTPKIRHPDAPEIAYTVEDRGHGTPCWVWALRTNNGYGVLSFRGRQWYAHRLIYEATHGPVPRGKELDHVCRVSLCVNPDHVEPVTHAENVQRGKTAKLTAGKVANIRGMASAGMPDRELADLFGVRVETIRAVVRRKTWRDVA